MCNSKLNGNSKNSILKIYPNPAKSMVNILSDETISALGIYDLTGKTIFTNQNVNAELTHIDVSAFCLEYIS